MQTATIEYPDEVRLSLNVTPEQFADEIRMTAAVMLFELGRLSSGRAAELAGVSRIRFLYEIGRYNVASFALKDDELMRDITNAGPA